MKLRKINANLNTILFLAKSALKLSAEMINFWQMELENLCKI